MDCYVSLVKNQCTFGKKFIDIYVVILPLPNTVENAISAAHSFVF